MKAQDVMTTKIITVSADNSVRQAAKVMLARHVSGLPVIDDDGRLVGLISEGDLLRRSELGSGSTVPREGPPPSSDERARTYVKSNAWRVGDVMSRDLVVVDEETPVLSRCLTSGRAEGSTEVSEYLSGNHPPLGHCD